MLVSGLASLARDTRSGRGAEMQFTFSEEQQAFAQSVQRFARAKLEPDALARAHDPRFPFEVAKLLSAQGLMGITLPEADGGQGGTLTDASIAIDQNATACPRSRRRGPF